MKKKPTKKPRLIEHDGKKQSIAAWSRDTGIASKTISDRLANGWTAERALTTTPATERGGADNRQMGKGRELKEGIVASYLKVWRKSGAAEFERQLAEAFATDALKTVAQFAQYLPKEAVERAASTTEKAVVRIELAQMVQAPRYLDADARLLEGNG